MSDWTFAFIATPAIVIALGYVAMRLHMWDIKRHRNEPGE